MLTEQTPSHRMPPVSVDAEVLPLLVGEMAELRDGLLALIGERLATDSVPANRIENMNRSSDIGEERFRNSAPGQSRNRLSGQMKDCLRLDPLDELVDFSRLRNI